MASQVVTDVPPPSASLGHWLPKDRAVIRDWLAAKLEEYDTHHATRPVHKTVNDLLQFVAANPYLSKLAQDMFIQIPPSFINDPTGQPQVRDFVTMLGLVNMILNQGPQFFDKPKDPIAMGMIGFPINAILDWPMGTQAGNIFFLNPDINLRWKAILDTWGSFLQTKESRLCLDQKNGWLSADALGVLAAKGNDNKTNLTFQQLYACDPADEYFGFGSWDAFFTRKFNPGVRPVAFPDNQPTPEQPNPTRVIVNACESGPLQFSTNVQLHDVFWLKQQPYSLADMLDNDPFADKFVGGSVYQAFLSALSYHCWHAPVSGTVAGIRMVPGTYYSEALDQGFTDPNAPNNSQPYISAVAARGIIFIQADDPTIGLMAIVFIGMAEVSSCEFLVREGDFVSKGDLIGMFHFGGSSHCMVFRPETNLQPHNFVVSQPPWTDDNNYPVCSALAVVTPPTQANGTRA